MLKRRLVEFMRPIAKLSADYPYAVKKLHNSFPRAGKIVLECMYLVYLVAWLCRNPPNKERMILAIRAALYAIILKRISLF